MAGPHYGLQAPVRANNKLHTLLQQRMKETQQEGQLKSSLKNVRANHNYLLAACNALRSVINNQRFIVNHLTTPWLQNICSPCSPGPLD